MKRYTVGFVFDSTMEHVLLIHKNRPEWQKGKVNGPGGKVEGDETPHECISREIREETSLQIPPEKWELFAEIGNDVENVKFLTAMHNQRGDVQSMTDEKLEWFSVNKIPLNAIDNLHWLIPLCMDHVKRKNIVLTKVEYRKVDQ